MPIFDRRCQECDHKEYDLFEQKFDDIKPCPKCNKLAFVKVYSAPHLPPDGMYSFLDAVDRN